MAFLHNSSSFQYNNDAGERPGRLNSTMINVEGTRQMNSSPQTPRCFRLHSFRGSINLMQPTQSRRVSFLQRPQAGRGEGLPATPVLPPLAMARSGAGNSGVLEPLGYLHPFPWQGEIAWAAQDFGAIDWAACSANSPHQSVGMLLW